MGFDFAVACLVSLKFFLILSHFIFISSFPFLIFFCVCVCLIESVFFSLLLILRYFWTCSFHPEVDNLPSYDLPLGH